MDISEMLVGKSDQIDNVDLLSGPRDFTITGVSKGNPDQPLDITVAEFDRAWRPGLTMRRLLAHIWGKDASLYVGRRVRLYRDAEVTFGKDKTGGTRISHASHMDKSVTVSLPTSKGKFGAFTVTPLPDAAPTITPATPEEVQACTEVDELRAMWSTATPEVQSLITARKAELDATAPAEGDS